MIMYKLDKKEFENHQNVQKIIVAQHKLAWDINNKFSWNVTIDNRRYHVKRIFLPQLLKATKNHCAFCDAYPLDILGINNIPIEHFEPKSKAPDKAYFWSNLFPVCYPCTDEKKDRFDDNLIKPDDDEYEFKKFFFVTGEGFIECVRGDKKSKASITIDIYKLNRSYLVKERKKSIRDYPKLQINNPDEYPYRYLIDTARRYKDPLDIINKYTT